VGQSYLPCRLTRLGGLDIHSLGMKAVPSCLARFTPSACRESDVVEMDEWRKLARTATNSAPLTNA
jgi:hypothetical protein